MLDFTLLESVVKGMTFCELWIKEKETGEVLEVDQLEIMLLREVDTRIPYGIYCGGTWFFENIVSFDINQDNIVEIEYVTRHVSWKVVFVPIQQN